eukprot:11189406-Lingulodinium_polyedra.AAC.2
MLGDCLAPWDTMLDGELQGHLGKGGGQFESSLLASPDQEFVVKDPGLWDALHPGRPQERVSLLVHLPRRLDPPVHCPPFARPPNLQELLGDLPPIAALDTRPALIRDVDLLGDRCRRVLVTLLVVLQALNRDEQHVIPRVSVGDKIHTDALLEICEESASRPSQQGGGLASGLRSPG